MTLSASCRNSGRRAARSPPHLADGFFEPASIFMLAGCHFALGDHGLEHAPNIGIRAAFACPAPAGTHVPVAHGAIDQAQRRKTNAWLALLNF